MRNASLALLLAAALAAACGESGGSLTDAAVNHGDANAWHDGGQPGPDGSHPGSDGGSPGNDGGGPGPDAAVSTMEYCLPTCNTPSDCNLGSAPYDADNYQCTGGVCVYQGCNSDAECQALGSYLCRTQPGSTVPYCLPACNTTADCNLGSAPYDADNYLCTNSVCVYQGCNSDAECQALGSYLCRTQAGSTAPYCLPACNTTADCNLGSAPYDADNYLCTGGVCVYQGCNSDAECQTMGNYECSPGASLPLP
ncbi:MAG: hypothetical protein ABI333_14435 [bacterium]